VALSLTSLERTRFTPEFIASDVAEAISVILNTPVDSLR
jgi:hypothetical protein